MTDHQRPHPDTDTPPRALAVGRLHSPVALIWIVPIAAILIALGLAVNAVLQRGPEISLELSSAEGLEANKTKIKYKDVDIGTVTAIGLGKDRRTVKVLAAMDRQAKPLLVEDSRFWVVRPRVFAGGVSGLGTLLSGAYIAVDPGKSSQGRHEFAGLDNPPLVVNDMSGRQFLLLAEDLGSLDVGVPVFYRRIPVGRVVSYAMRPDGRGVEVRIFVDAPYDRFVTAGARFWNASGVDLSLNAEGMRLETQSLVSVALGGIAFGAMDDAERPEAQADARFPLYPDRSAAMRQPDGVMQKFLLRFDESVRGLTVGAPVDFRGLPAGEVARIDLDFDEHGQDATVAVEINVYPDRFTRQVRSGPRIPATAETTRRVVDGMVARGFRAQVRTGNLLTGQRYVALDFFPKAKPAKVRWSGKVPELPSQPGSLDSLQDQLEHIADNLQALIKRTDTLVTNVDRHVLPELTSTLHDARQTLDRANGVLASDGPTQSELRDTLREVGRAATSVRALADLLERHPEALINGKKANP